MHNKTQLDKYMYKTSIVQESLMLNCTKHKGLQNH